MPNKAQGSKRTLAKKVTSFNMYLDQATQIQAIMEATGADKDAPVLRTLLDEALANRRRRAAGMDTSDKADNGMAQAIETLHTLILKAISLGEKSLRIEGFNLKLLQETFAEAHGARKLVWTELSAASLRNQGITPDVIAARFELQTLEAKETAYGMARTLMHVSTKDASQDLSSPASGSRDEVGVDLEVDDNQPMLF
jgi:hypothetical protein